MIISRVNVDTEEARTLVPKQLSNWLNPEMGGSDEFIRYSAKEEEEVLGYIIYGRIKEYDQAYQIVYVFVEEQHRGRGIAKELVRVSAGFVRELGAKRIILSEGPEGLLGKFLLEGNVDYKEKQSTMFMYTVGAVKNAVVSDKMQRIVPFFKNIRSKDEIKNTRMIDQFEEDSLSKNLKVSFDEVDPDYSCFWVSDGRICASMIVSDMEEGFFFVKNTDILHKNDSTKYAIPIMMAYLVNKSMAVCPDDTRFGINIIDNKIVGPTREYLGEPIETNEYTDYYLQ